MSSITQKNEYSIPLPKFTVKNEETDLFEFSLSGLNVSLANAIRRVIISDIPVVGFYTETHEKNDCKIEINTTGIHNQILEHALMCIPVYTTKLDELPGKYILDVDVINTTDNALMVSTEHFRVKSKTTGQYLSKEETAKLFPKNEYGRYIDFVEIGPQMNLGVQEEKRLKLTSEFSLVNASVNGAFNVVCKCAMTNTVDPVRASKEWDDREADLATQEKTKEEIEYEKRDFFMLDAKRFTVPDSFDFAIETIGIYENRDIIKMACAILQTRLVDLIDKLESDGVPILDSENTMENCYDIILENEGYTIGKVIEYVLYNMLFEKEETLSFCGFIVLHPSDKDSRIRVAYKNKVDKSFIKMNLRNALYYSQEFYKKLHGVF